MWNCQERAAVSRINVQEGSTIADALYATLQSLVNVVIIFLITDIEPDIEQVQNEKKSFTFRCMFLRPTQDDSGEEQRWTRSMLNAWITSGSLPM